MKHRVRTRQAALVIVPTLVLLAARAAVALQAPATGGRFDALIVVDAANAQGVVATPVASLPAGSAVRAGWDQFRASHGRDWSIHVDRRSGAPLLVEGRGIPWPTGDGTTIDTLAASLRAFVAGNKTLLVADDAELVLDREASGLLLEDVWQLAFNREVAGIPVAGDRYLFTIGHGRLISFGTPRWSRVDASPSPSIGALEARERVLTYMGMRSTDAVDLFSEPKLEFDGALGAGGTSALVWRVALRVSGEPGTWVARLDAHTGAIRSFADDNRYARVKGGIYPISDDQICPDGCEQPNFPMPFANISIGGTPQTANTLGVFNCTPGGSSATTTLAGPYVKVVDVCGPISQSVACSADIDLSTSGGIDCAVPAGASAGNTHSARSSFYHLNRIAEHARSWLPTRTWLTSQLTDNVNINQTCNAYWDGSSVNFFKSGGNCRNTGEIAGVFLHEWGHGLDQNDGGSFDNPSEAYADVTAFMSTHTSCIGRGFRKSGNCGGYGNACLNCTGVRDQDWDQRANHVPSTPAGFLANNCPGGSGPCGKEEHCESYVGAETLWDLAVRDLPASGLDLGSSWQLADKLWYKSRLGSGGNAYNCSLPSSDGCAATSWFAKLRVVDDDDGNLANGTPHAAAIFAAFDRHKIACGAATDASNQNSGTCPVIGAPLLSATAGSSSAQLSWTAAANSVGYRILRNDAGCDAGTTRLSVLTGTSFNDTALVNGLTFYYSVQGIASNSACDGPVSNCQAVTPQSAAGSIAMNAAVYGCTGQIDVTLIDGNVGAATTTATFVSTTESPTETITLTRIAPGSATYAGSIPLSANAPAHDGVLSVANGDTITARYVDASDGAGRVNVPRLATATVACAAPGVAKPVADGSFGTAMTGSRLDAAGSAIDLTWDVATCASSDHHVLYGDLASVSSTTVLGAVCDLGTTGSATWSGVPAGDLWFVVVGDDNATIEGNWGTDGSGAQRGAGVSGRCGTTTRDDSGVCP